MRIVYFLTTAIQFVFIVLVFVIIFYKPKYESNSAVLGLSIDVKETLAICKSDINKDTFVDYSDFLMLQTRFLGPSNKENLIADLTGDFIIDLEDFTFLAKSYGGRCY